MSQLTLTALDAATPTITLAGRLDAVSLGPVWAQARQALARNESWVGPLHDQIQPKAKRKA